MWIGIKENKPQKNCATKIYRKTAKIQHKKLQNYKCLSKGQDFRY